MSHRMFSLCLSILLLSGFSQAVQADVTGSFDIDITLTPESVLVEAARLHIDLQSNLQVNTTLSGITFGMDVGFGVTGIEFGILNLTTNLGALFIFDQFVFAAPFGCANFQDGVTNTSGGITGQCVGPNTTAIGDGDSDGVIDNAVGFVKKRISIQINLAGVQISNLAIFEDVDFPDIQGLNPIGLNDHEHDHFGPDTPYFVSQTNPIANDQTPTFGFGDVITLSGQTVSGIAIGSVTQFCAKEKNYIKKRSFDFEVNAACSAQFADPTANPIGSGGPVLFEQETLTVENVDIPGGILQAALVFTPLAELEVSVSMTTNLLGLVDITSTFTSRNITNLNFSSTQIDFQTGNISLSIFDLDGNFEMDLLLGSFNLVLFPDTNPVDVSAFVNLGRTGISTASVDFGLMRGPFSLDSTTTLERMLFRLEWARTSFGFHYDNDAGLTFGTTLTVNTAGMENVTLTMGVVF